MRPAPRCWPSRPERPFCWKKKRSSRWPMPLSSVLQVFKPKPKSGAARKVRVGLVGAGRMGQLHAKLLRENRGAELVGIVDQYAVRCQPLAKKYKTQAFTRAT